MGGYFCLYEGCDNFFSIININIYAAKEGGHPFGFGHFFLPLFLGTGLLAFLGLPFKRQGRALMEHSKMDCRDEVEKVASYFYFSGTQGALEFLLVLV